MTGLMKRSGKRTVCGMVSSRNRKPPCGKKLVWQRLCTMRRLLCLYSNRPLRELSGLALGNLNAKPAESVPDPYRSEAPHSGALERDRTDAFAMTRVGRESGPSRQTMAAFTLNSGPLRDRRARDTQKTDESAWPDPGWALFKIWSVEA